MKVGKSQGSRVHIDEDVAEQALAEDPLATADPTDTHRQGNVFTVYLSGLPFRATEVW